MKDKNGKQLEIGDKVKIFTYTKATVLFFVNQDGEEMAHTKDTYGNTNTVYSEEIRRFEWKGYSICPQCRCAAFKDGECEGCGMGR